MKPIIYQSTLTPEFVMNSLHLKIPFLPDPQFPFQSVQTDSRKIKPGCLFVALKGEKFDGHSFIQAALNQGARGIVYKRGYSVPHTKGVSLFPVEDTLKAYRKIAAKWRHEFSIPIIAVGGSAGKTTTKELLSAILQGKWSHVLKTQESQNGFIGIPMTLLELRSEHQAAVIEVGIDEIGAMQEHVNMLCPSAGVLTAIGPEHLEKLQDIPTVAREEGILLSQILKEGGLAAIHADDPWIRPHLTTHLGNGKKIPFSMVKSTLSHPELVSGHLSSSGEELIIQGYGLSKVSLPMPLPGKHNAYNLLAATTLALGLGLSIDEIRQGLKSFKGAEGRSEIKEISPQLSVVCDYYNAQPASMRAGLELVTEISNRPGKTGTRWACLADMLELGAEEDKLHRQLADQLIELKVENVLLFGPRMNALANELEKRNFRGYLSHFSSHSEMADTLKTRMKPGDSILIKGSRGMRMEEVWKLIEKESNQSENSSSQNTSPHS